MLRPRNAMESLTLFVPAVYAAALAWAIGGDFVRAQLDKDLEHDPPAMLRRGLRVVSPATFCLVGALLLRSLTPIRGLLLVALFVAAALSLWKIYRASLLRAATASANRRPVN